MFDDFLTPGALQSLREFCLSSTIYFTNEKNDFVESNHTSGFNCDLLYQIAEELKEHFPRVLNGLHLVNMWIYRHNNQSDGATMHSDEGEATFNFYITPDDANRIPDRGGLTVFAKEQPSEWDWRYYNQMRNTPEISREIDAYLADADTITVPHRANRAILFRSSFLPKSDLIDFKDGFENRRMNITLLFRRREG